MTVFALIPEPKRGWLDTSGDPLNGGKLFVYEAGGSTKATSYKDSDGAVQNANPIVLDSRGETPDGCYVATGSYKLVLAPSTDTDPPASAIWTRDNLNPVNDTAQTVTEWSTTGLTPTYVDADEFTLVGDQTTNHHVGRRIKATVTAGTVYGYISVSTWSDPNTDLTVVLDSGSLDSGLSVVDLGLMRSDGTSSIPQQNVTTTGTSFTGTVSVGGTLTAGATFIQKQGTDVASATTLLVNVDGNLFDVTGTTNIGALASKGVGTVITLQFDGILTLAHHATDLVLPGGADITTAAGDVATFYEYASGDWRLVSYQQGVGLARVPTHWFTQLTNAGTETSYTWTGIPATAKRVRIALLATSISGTNSISIRLGSSTGGVAATGYNGVMATSSANTASTTGFQLCTSAATGDAFYGSIVIEPMNLTSQNIWTANWSIARTNNVVLFDGAGTVDLTASNTLDRAQIIVSASDVFDSGNVYGWYE